uniref:Uncharacterized protein n=1 Tax=Caenorhabditis japonica TaxID=281687 RepID=A0A8R1DLP8_CAEJA
MLISAAFTASDDRLMGWNKAHGLWGKRSEAAEVEQNKRFAPRNWNKLNSLWGKRSFDSTDYGSDGHEIDDVAQQFYKRSPQWQRANGLWGR